MIIQHEKVQKSEAEIYCFFFLVLTNCYVLFYIKTVLINFHLICIHYRPEKSNSIQYGNSSENTRSKSAVEKSIDIYTNEGNNDFFNGYEVPIKLRNEDLSSEEVYVEMKNNY